MMSEREYLVRKVVGTGRSQTGLGEEMGDHSVCRTVIYPDMLQIIILHYFSGALRYTQMCDGLLTATMRSTRSGNSWQPESLQTKEEVGLEKMRRDGSKNIVGEGRRQFSPLAGGTH